jgi:hypothetical protein
MKIRSSPGGSKQIQGYSDALYVGDFKAFLLRFVRNKSSEMVIAL